jgi:hypothetical protein
MALLGVLHAGYAELAASAVLVVVRAIHPAPGVGAADFYFPAMLFSIPKSLIDLRFGMFLSGHLIL